MNKLQFAQLVAYVVYLMNSHRDETLDCQEIEYLERLTTVEPTPSKVNAASIDELMGCVAEGTHKIDAIKLYRQLTGLGLKESKDAVEKYWLLGRQQPITMDTF